MTDAWDDWVKEFDDALRPAVILQFMARDKDLQRDAAENLKDVAAKAEQMRVAMLTEGRMDEALRSLGGRFLAQGIRFELLMYICLKDGKADEAWNNLIKAQMHYSYAVRSHPAWEAQLSDKLEHLARMESDLFPPQVFMSAGLIVREQECSICKQDYETCDHISGKIYEAEFCAVRLKNVTADHIAIVEEPANKMCRITHFATEEGRRNRMTWAIVPDGKFSNEPSPDGALHAEAIIAASMLESDDPTDGDSRESTKIVAAK